MSCPEEESPAIGLSLALEVVMGPTPDAYLSLSKRLRVNIRIFVSNIRKEKKKEEEEKKSK